MRAQLVEIIGVDLVDASLHAAVYGDADPPRRALVGGIAPTHKEISILFHQPFPVSYQRVPDLTDEAYAIYMIWLPRGLHRTTAATSSAHPHSPAVRHH
jgi:hypothetical protein